MLNQSVRQRLTHSNSLWSQGRRLTAALGLATDFWLLTTGYGPDQEDRQFG
jgi:hypothetical protein